MTSRKKGKLPPIKSAELVLRAVMMPSGIKDVVVATETPVRRYDEERGYVINEVLLMEGVVLRTNQQQMPIVDSHDESTVRNILGSIRSLQVINGELHHSTSTRITLYSTRAGLHDITRGGHIRTSDHSYAVAAAQCVNLCHGCR
jgi:hypothetical protein